jgi:hypothetical protein
MRNLDLAITNINSNSTLVVLGDGTGGFGPPTTFRTWAGKVLISTSLTQTSADICDAKHIPVPR